MGKFYSESMGESVYLVYEVSENEQIDSVSSGMLSINTIPGVAKTVISQIDYTKYIRFDVTSKISLDQILSRAIDRKTTVRLFSGITNALIAAEQYVLTPDCFLLDTKYIYSNTLCTDVLLICLPIEGQHGTSDLRGFFKTILFNMKFTEESDLCIGKIISFLNSDSAFTLEKFSAFLAGIDGEKGTAKSDYIPRQVENAYMPKNLTPSGSARHQEFIKQPVSSAVPVVQHVPAPDSHSTPTLAHTPDPESFKIPENIHVAVSGKKVKKPEEKSISLFYLLQHYNKENASIYRAQKKSKKLGKSQKSKSVSSGAKSKPKNKLNASFDFDVPLSDLPQQIKPEIDAAPQTRPEPILVPGQNTNKVSLQPANFGDTVFASEDNYDDITRFNESSSICPMLIRIKNNERIRIDKELFRLGRDREFNDYYVNDPGISHVHCHIVIRNKEYFIVDDNSKNHTYVDNAPIPPSTEVKLSHGQKFRLSDEEFEFLLY